MHLTEQFQLGHRTLRNRIVSTAHSEQLAVDGLITPHLEDYHVRRARGGAGLIIAFGSAGVSAEATNRFNPALWNSDNEPALRRMADGAHNAGSALIAQVTHRGVREDNYDPDILPVAPSLGVGGLPGGFARVLSKDDIAALVRAYADVADRLYRCGWDGIEVTVYGMHLIEQFWSPVLNRRDDSYGGSFENRMRFGAQVLEAVRSAVPDDFVVALRISLDARTERLGLSRDDLLEIARHYDTLGVVDLFDVIGSTAMTADGAVGTVPTADYASGVYRDLAARARPVLRSPILVAGRILDIGLADEIVGAGDADLVGMTRAMIADPELAARIEDGRHDLARPCISINEGCRRVTVARKLACSVNPEVAHPELATQPRVEGPSTGQTLVIGAGPAGIEVANVLSAGGLTTKLLEQAESIGGRIDYALLGDPDQLDEYRRWAETTLSENGAEVSLRTQVTPELVAQLAPERVVFAGGSVTTQPPWISARYETCSDVDYLSGTWRPRTGPVIVYDPEGYSAGCVTALRLVNDLESPSDITLVTPLSAAGERVEGPNRTRLIKNIMRTGIHVVPYTEILGDSDSTLFLRNVVTKNVTEIDQRSTIVGCGYRAADDHQFTALQRAYPNAEWHTVGDATAPGLIRHAVAGGRRLGHAILHGLGARTA